MNSPCRTIRCTVWMIFFIILAGATTSVAGIQVKIIPSQAGPVWGEKITMAVVVDVTAANNALGSYTAKVSWNSEVLRYAGLDEGITPGFSNPLVNETKAQEGRLVVAHANPQGGSGEITLMKLRFDVIGSAGSDTDVQVEFTAMAAVYTFDNLLPHLTSVVTGIRDRVEVSQLPHEFALHQNHPNPFNPETEIRVEVPFEGPVQLTIFNVLGQRVKTLVNGSLLPGRHALRWDGKDETGNHVPSGIYLYRMEGKDFLAEKKMMLVR